MQDEWGPAVLEGWSRAAIAHQDPAWAEALWDAWERRLTRDARALAVAPELSAGLLRCLAPETAARLAMRLLADPDAAADARWRDVLSALPTPWSAEFGHRYLAVMRRRAAARRAEDRDLWTWTLSTAAHALPPACFAAALQEWSLPDADGWYAQQWRRAFDRFLETIHTRQRLLDLIEEIER